MSDLKDLQLHVEKLEKKLEAATNTAKQPMKELDELMDDGYWDWYVQEDYEYFSPRFWDILGYNYLTKKHKPSEWQDLIHPEDLKAALTAYDRHVKTKGTYPYELTARYTHGVTGDWVRVRCCGKVIEWDGDDPVRMLGTHQLLGSRSGLI